ncbi:HD-GYP domain-containing protein [Alteromonas aestuariivivens]|uniref:HD-GYP domain-containing protein n=1 Tax=Alteromonas aestuariivivens TaxID=1938339 RepID=A0A3D8M3Y2_9ALTE|nr:HD-GYP domain-containing protein [Alteromonas aestuariivivens]RDV24346.1 HD-GYP domain-containing protein [Alteromonas aestuariivivens]
MLKNISIDELKPGMYVNQVIRQSGRLKMRSKGVVKTQSVVEMLKAKGILELEIDLSRSQMATPETTLAADKKPLQKAAHKARLSPSQALNAANELHQQAVSIQRGLLRALKNGAACDMESATKLSGQIISSVLENPSALSCLAHIKDKDQYLLEHSINCCILMAIFASHLGYDQATTEQVCLGVLLMDLGMSEVPDALRCQGTKLSAEQWQQIQAHVTKGTEMVETAGCVPELVLTVIQQHHERQDGTGYPAGLSGDEISEFARMAAIVDSYDAMISQRSHQNSVTPALALKRLTKEKGLDQTLVKQFIQCLGVHPVGSLVKLKSGKLGIVTQLGKSDLLKPVIMTFYNVNAGHYSEIKQLDLSRADDDIVSVVRPDEFGINLPKFFRDVFLHQIPDK